MHPVALLEDKATIDVFKVVRIFAKHQVFALLRKDFDAFFGIKNMQRILIDIRRDDHFDKNFIDFLCQGFIERSVNRHNATIG